MSKQTCAPLPDELGTELPDRNLAEEWLDVLCQQPSIKIRCPRPQARPLGDPSAGIVTKPDLGPSRIRPVATSELRLDKDQEAIGVSLALEGVRSVSPQPVKTEIAGLVSSRRQPADVAETPMARSVPLGHHATPLV
jgi:hypothetical protein